VKGENEMYEKENDEVYAIMDSSNNYADADSLYVKNGKVRYSPSKGLINGCHYFDNIALADKNLNVLNKF
jgi:hypothetical protein